MGHDHDHSHHGMKTMNTAFVLGIGLNLVFVFVEIIAGIKTNSLALLTDAGHNLLDVGSLALSLLAFRLAKVKSTEKYTYGYKKTTILASLVNGIFLLVAVGAILWETFTRFGKPVHIDGGTVALVAFIGIVINGSSAFLFFKNKDKDLNIKGAYLHLLADALVSLGVVTGGIVMYYTELFWIDSALSIVIALVILYSTWGLLKESLLLELNGVPKNIDLKKVREQILKSDKVKGIHHLHVWAISTTENAMTAHLVVEQTATLNEIATVKEKLKHLLEHQHIHHVTLEVEQENENCKGKIC